MRTYPYLIVPVIAWAIAQSLKVITDSFRHRRLDVARLGSSGGMPSSHTAMVAALTTLIGIHVGVRSAEFAVSAIFSAVVMYDAAGVRRAVGIQARVLNRIVDDLLRQEGIKEDRLRELLGHTPFEVYAGALLGIGLGLLLGT
ncbi:MAG: divergent PAP2 family protein [Candidatus Dormibacteria bacterium]